MRITPSSCQQLFHFSHALAVARFFATIQVQQVRNLRILFGVGPHLIDQIAVRLALFQRRYRVSVAAECGRAELEEGITSFDGKLKSDPPFNLMAFNRRCAWPRSSCPLRVSRALASALLTFSASTR